MLKVLSRLVVKSVYSFLFDAVERGNETRCEFHVEYDDKSYQR